MATLNQQKCEVLPRFELGLNLKADSEREYVKINLLRCLEAEIVFFTKKSVNSQGLEKNRLRSTVSNGILHVYIPCIYTVYIL